MAMTDAGTQVTMGDRVYEWDGADWWCPSNNHDPGAAFDDLLDTIVALRAERDRAVAALTELQEGHAQAQQAIGMARLYLDRFSTRPNRISDALAALSSPEAPNE
jgi:hypothetical protein